MNNLDDEQHRVLLGRIIEALDDAKYYPATVGGVDGPARVAAQALKPYQPRLSTPVVYSLSGGEPMSIEEVMAGLREANALVNLTMHHAAATPAKLNWRPFALAASKLLAELVIADLTGVTPGPGVPVCTRCGLPRALHGADLKCPTEKGD